MNKTVTVNIAKIVFHIDENAYYKLDNYLKSIQNSINSEESKDEIINDIENRIAELLTEKIPLNNGIVSEKDVDFIIQTMGQPEDYNLEDENNLNNGSSQHYKVHKKLYRDADNRLLGGVLAGLSHYLNIDTVWLRLIFITLLFLGISIIVYPILWIVIPKAVTTSQKLEMMGEPVNINNIGKVVNENFYKAMEKIQHFSTNHTKSISSVILKALGITLTIIGILGCILSTIIVLSELYTSNTIWYIIDIEPQIASITTEILTTSKFQLALIFVCFIPFILLTIWGIKLLYPKGNYKGVIITSIILKIILLSSIFYLISVGLNLTQKRITEAIEMRKNIELKEEKHIIPTQEDNIVLSFEKRSTYNTLHNQGTVDTYIYETAEKEPYIIVKQYILKNNFEHKYEYNIKSDTIILPTHYAKKQNFDPDIEVLIYLPKNKSIQINSMDRNYIENDVRLIKGIHKYQFLNGNLLKEPM